MVVRIGYIGREGVDLECAGTVDKCVSTWVMYLRAVAIGTSDMIESLNVRLKCTVHVLAECVYEGVSECLYERERG